MSEAVSKAAVTEGAGAAQHATAGPQGAISLLRRFEAKASIDAWRPERARMAQ
jgi:hypothetical protein